MAAVQQQEKRLAALAAAQPESLSPVETDRLMNLGADLETVWNHPSASAETRKRILRTVLEEIVATLEDGRIELLLHWRGGDHTRLSVRRNRTGQHRWSTSTEVGALIRTLARQQTDGRIAATLNRLGKKTGPGNAWTEARVRSFRKHHRVPVYRPGERAERGELTVNEAASRLKIGRMSVLRLIASGTIEAQQVCKGAPWVIPEAQLADLEATISSGGRPRTGDPNQKVLDLQ